MTYRPKIFIGSSSEGLQIARALCMNLDYLAEVSVWTDNVFRLSRTTTQSLYEALDQSDYGAFVLTADDLLKHRGKNYGSPRDNVIFELGLFAGRLGLDKTFIIHPRTANLKLPTDLLGITTATYETNSSGNWAAALGAATGRIEKELDERKRTPERTDVTWEDICRHTKHVGDILRRSPHSGGFMPDLLLGISRGGIVVADLLSRYLGGRVPTLCLWADRYSTYGSTSFSPLGLNVNACFEKLLQQEVFKNILIVDDVSRTGTTIRAAQSYVSRVAGTKTVRTLILFTAPSGFQPDFWAVCADTTTLRLPFSVLG